MDRGLHEGHDQTERYSSVSLQLSVAPTKHATKAHLTLYTKFGTSDIKYYKFSISKLV